MNEPKEISLNIGGMSCASCVARVEKAAKKVAGVEEAIVNLATESARISFQANETNAEVILAAIRKAGYEASLKTNDTLQPKSERLQDDLRLKFILSSLLSIPLLLPMLGGFMLPPWLQLALATPVQFYIGAAFYKGAYQAVRAKSGNMDLLVALGTSAAFALSLYHLLNGAHGHELYFESSAVIITLVLLGKFLETRAKRQTSSAIRALQDLRPMKARVWRAETWQELPSASIRVGDKILVLAGESIPVDGKVIEGEGLVDESLITGESLPVAKSVSSSVTGGTINGNNPLTLTTLAIGKDTLLSKIVDMVEEAQAKKASIQRLVDKVSAIFVPSVLLISLLVFFSWGFIGGDWEAAIIHAVSVIVIACPCALGLATPTSILVGTGAAARAGILIRDAETLEILHNVKHVAFDKTGTLTKGEPSLVSFDAYQGSETQSLAIAAGLSLKSEHPLAKATLRRARELEIGLDSAERIEVLPGGGIRGEWQGRKYALVSQSYLKENYPQLILRESESQTTQSFLFDEELAIVLAKFSYEDEIKAGAKDAVSSLHALGIKTTLISGDAEGPVRKVAEELGIDDFYARVKPDGKATLVRNLKQKNTALAMVGDGINDAPALAEADVGMAMAKGTDVAMQTAGIVLMTSHPLLVVDALRISRATYSKIKQNLFWAFIYNVIGIPLAAFGILSPMLAGAAMALSSVSVVSNSLLLKRWKPS